MKYDYKKLSELCNQRNMYFDTISIISNILDRIEDPSNDEDVLQSIDDELIYYHDQWQILKQYCTPQEANWENAIEEFTCLIFSLSALLYRDTK